MSGETTNPYNNEREENVARAEHMAYAEDPYHENIKNIQKADEAASKALGESAFRATLDKIFRSKKEKERIQDGEKRIYKQLERYDYQTRTPKEIHEKIVTASRRAALTEAIKNEEWAAKEAAKEAGVEYDKQMGIGDDFERDPLRAEFMAYAENPVREEMIEIKKKLSEFLSLPLEEQVKIASQDDREEKIKEERAFYRDIDPKDVEVSDSDIVSDYIASKFLSSASESRRKADASAERAKEIYDADKFAQNRMGQIINS